MRSHLSRSAVTPDWPKWRIASNHEHKMEKKSRHPGEGWRPENEQMKNFVFDERASLRRHDPEQVHRVGSPLSGMTPHP